MTDSALGDRFETAFRAIAADRMEGVPILNPALNVAMRGWQRHERGHLGILITPWFMNLVIVPDEPAQRQVGSKTNIVLPSGQYQAVWNFEPDLAGFWAVSLFSPMFEFGDQDSAVATADAALAEMLTPPGEPTDEDKADQRMAMVWAGATGQNVTPPPSPVSAATDEDRELPTTDGPAKVSRRGLFGIPAEPVTRP